MKKKIDLAFLTIAVEVPVESNAIEHVSDWLTKLPPEYSGQSTHGFMGMTLTQVPLDNDEISQYTQKYSAWYRTSSDVRN